MTIPTRNIRRIETFSRFISYNNIFLHDLLNKAVVNLISGIIRTNLKISLHPLINRFNTVLNTVIDRYASHKQGYQQKHDS